MSTRPWGSHRAAGRRPSLTGNRGFTLIEILVVLVLVVVLASVVALSIGQGSLRRDLINEAQRFHQVLRMAADEAVYQNVEIGVRLDEGGYEFLGYSEEKQQWVELPQPFLKRRQFPDWVELEFTREAGRVNLPLDEESGNNAKIPQLLLLSSGESTPFRIQMAVDGDNDYFIVIASDGINEIRYEETAEQ